MIPDAEQKSYENEVDHSTKKKGRKKRGKTNK